MRRLAAGLLLCAASVAAAMEAVSVPSQDGKLALPGYWFAASGGGPRPAVIALHGCGGLLDAQGRLGANYFRVAELFNVESIHYLAIDSMTPRGEKSVCEIPARQRRVRVEDRRADAYAAIDWLARRADVDRSRIAVVGYSMGGSTVLSTVERAAPAVQAQAIRPRAAVAFYPGCAPYAQRSAYEVGVPLLVLIGAADEWTPAHHCVRLAEKVQRAQGEGALELIVYPDAHHGFDGYGPLRIRSGLPTLSGKATVGGHPEAREQALRRMFDFLAAQLEAPLSLSHEQRLHGHRYVVPPASDFARADDITVIPLAENGRERFQHYLTLPAPKAFAITERGGWFFSGNNAQAMRTVMQRCPGRCWLYAVDDRVVWSADPAARIDLGRLEALSPAIGAPRQ